MADKNENEHNYTGTPDTVELDQPASVSVLEAQVEQVPIPVAPSNKPNLHLGDKLTELASRREKVLQDTVPQ